MGEVKGGLEGGRVDVCDLQGKQGHMGAGMDDILLCLWVGG